MTTIAGALELSSTPHAGAVGSTPPGKCDRPVISAKRFRCTGGLRIL